MTCPLVKSTRYNGAAMSSKAIPIALVFMAVCLCSAALRGRQENKEEVPAWSLKFEDYPAGSVFKGKPAAPVLATKSDRMFRTQIREAARKGPNFAGHYTIAEWGCGGGCVSLAVIDAISGRVFTVPFKNLTLQSDRNNGRDFQGPVYKANSRLFIADGCPNETNCGTYYYEWINNKFKLLKQDRQSPNKK